MPLLGMDLKIEQPKASCWCCFTAPQAPSPSTPVYISGDRSVFRLDTQKDLEKAKAETIQHLRMVIEDLAQSRMKLEKIEAHLELENRLNRGEAITLGELHKISNAVREILSKSTPAIEMRSIQLSETPDNLLSPTLSPE